MLFTLKHTEEELPLLQTTNRRPKRFPFAIWGVVVTTILLIAGICGYQSTDNNESDQQMTLGFTSPLFPLDEDSLVMGLNYDIRQGADWVPNKCKNASQIKRDLTIARTITKHLRIYSLSDCDVAPVLTAAKSLNLTVWLGVWVTSDRSVYEREVKALQVLIDAGLIDDNVIGFNVGSEAVYRKDLTPAQAVDYLNEFKEYMLLRNLTNKLYSITDIVDVLAKNPEMVEAGDVITANQFPFWDQAPVDIAGENLRWRMQQLIAVAKEKQKRVIISETGWATAGTSLRTSNATALDAVIYLQEFHALALELQLHYYYFCAFDTPYKTTELQDDDTVEANFGIFYANGTMKEAYVEAGYHIE